MCTSISNHLEKAATRVLIFKIFLQMVREIVNALTKNRYLYLRRARVLVVDCGIFDDFFLFSLCQHGPYGSTAGRFPQGPALVW